MTGPVIDHPATGPFTGAVAGSQRADASPRTGLARAAVLLAFVAAAVFGWASPAAAHAVLTGSTPENGAVLDKAPTTVTLRFSESVQPVAGQVRVLDPDGERADRGEPSASGGEVRIKLRDGGGRGTYLVSYRVVSSDGHPVAGGLTYSVGEPSSSPPSAPSNDSEPDSLVSGLLSGVRYLGYAGLVLLVGAVGALGYVWPSRLSRRRPRRLAWWGLSAVAVSTLAELWLHTPYLLGTGVTGAGIGDVIGTLDSPYGYAHLARAGCVALAVPLLLRVCRGPLVGRAGESTSSEVTGGESTGREVTGGERADTEVTDGEPAGTEVPRGVWDWLWWSAPLLLGVALLLTWPLSGHPATAPLAWLAVVLDTAHLAAMSVWLGGLLVLLACLLPGAPRRVRSTLLPAWSRWALVSVIVLVVSGVSHAALQVTEFSQLGGTRYGALLVAKVGILAFLLIAAWLARRYVQRDEPVADIRRVIGVEVLFAAVVLAVTSVLVQTTPARTEAAVQEAAPAPRAYRTSLDSSLYRLQITIEPARVGNNSLELHATSLHGGTLPVEEWRVTAALPERDIEPIEVPLLELTPGQAVGEITLPSAGKWEFRFTLRTSEIDQATVRTTVPVR